MPQKTKKCGQKNTTVCVSYCCRATKKRYQVHRTRFFEKCSYVRLLLIDGGAVQKILGDSTSKNKSNDLEPHFPTSATKSRCLEDTKTAATLPHCSESTKRSIVGWWTFGLVVGLELGRNHGTSYVKKTEVEVLPSLLPSLIINTSYQKLPFRSGDYPDTW